MRAFGDKDQPVVTGTPLDLIRVEAGFFVEETLKILMKKKVRLKNYQNLLILERSSRGLRPGVTDSLRRHGFGFGNWA